ncbi:unnamed protein product [marine sediment metagenome]|uniref:Uncharacterized protein n=1 Tax=marine sediment metagenome TaxID=412755 RepID=X0SCJ0_9ZZZZ
MSVTNPTITTQWSPSARKHVRVTLFEEVWAKELSARPWWESPGQRVLNSFITARTWLDARNSVKDIIADL